MNKEEYNSKVNTSGNDSEDTIYQEVKQNVHDESTHVLSTFKNNPQPVIVDMEPVVDTFVEEVETTSVKEPGGMSKWKKVTIGGVTGIAMGIASAYGLHVANQPSVEPVPEPKPEPRPIRTPDTPEPVTPPVVEDIEDVKPAALPPEDFKVATNVHDNMTFGEAFQAARSQVGPGGLFEFEGEIYSTYNEEEWDAMSMAEKDDYNERLNEHIRENHHPDVTHHEANVSNDVLQTETTTVGEEANEAIQTTEAVKPEQKFEIHHIAEDSERGISQVVGHIGDTGITFMDTPDTPYIEYAVVDRNHNGVADDGEVLNITDCQYTMDDITAGTPYEGYQTPEIDNSIEV